MFCVVNQWFGIDRTFSSIFNSSSVNGILKEEYQSYFSLSPQFGAYNLRVILERTRWNTKVNVNLDEIFSLEDHRKDKKEGQNIFQAESWLNCEEKTDYVTPKPRSVWANISEITEPKNLENKFFEYRWISENLNVRNNLLQTKIKTITCLLWIEFEPLPGNQINVVKQLTEMFIQQKDCDTLFTFDDEESIGGHRSILSARSSVFASILRQEEAKAVKIHILDVTSDIFKMLLYYIYAGQLPIRLTQTYAQQLYEAASKYGVEDLQMECLNFLLSLVSVENAISLMVWSHLNSIEKLRDATLKFIAHHGEQIRKQKQWKELIENYPELSLLVIRDTIGQVMKRCAIITKQSEPVEVNAHHKLFQLVTRNEGG